MENVIPDDYVAHATAYRSEKGAFSNPTERIDMKNFLQFIGMIGLLTIWGCAPVVIGAGAAGAYKVATEERTFGRMWDDSNLTATIKAELSQDPIVNAPDVDVDTKDGNVVLSGVVTSEEQITRAVKIAGSYEGVKSVTNNLQVGSKTIGDVIGDKVIVSKIKGKLIAEPGIRSMNIDVDAQKGVVTLTGLVYDPLVKEQIIKIAEETAGTVRVVDHIQVK
jgi:hyperosmotically inducible periplasmic protein